MGDSKQKKNFSTFVKGTGEELANDYYLKILRDFGWA
jgi:hypothetical protein